MEKILQEILSEIRLFIRFFNEKPQYYYTVERMSFDNRLTQKEYLNSKTKEGFELIQVIKDGAYYEFYFKFKI